MRTVKNLINAIGDKKLGNHRVENEGNYSSYIYYWTTICKADSYKKIFWIDNSWGSSSTTRACNAYRREFLSLGYKEVKKGDF